MIASALVNQNWLHTQGRRRICLQATLWLIAGAVGAPFAVLRADEYYTVKRSDTLYGIARSYGIAPGVLAERNGLSRNSYVYAGQRLVVPVSPKTKTPAKSGATQPQAATRSKVPPSVQRAIEAAEVKPGRWKYIVIHHSAVDTGSVKAMDHYHRDIRHMENGLAYHFVIGNGQGIGNGQIAVCERWKEQLDGGHLASEAQNRIALGICLVGNFDKHAPSAKQIESLRALTEALLARCKLPPSVVKTHQQINVVHTRCPGTKFPAKTFIDSLKPLAGAKSGRR